MVEYLSGNRIQGSSTLSVPPAKTSWKELARASLSSAGDTITTSTFTAKDNMKVLTFGLASGNIEASLQVGNGSIDTGSNYSVRWQVNGTEGTGTGKTSIDTNHTASGNEFITYDITNVANQEKLVIADLVDSNSAGAGNAPNRVEHVGKWANTSNQINIAQAKNVGGGSFDTGSEIVVIGCDNDEADSGTPYWERLADFTQTTASSSMDTGTFTAKKYLWIQVHEIANANLDMNYLRFNSDSGSNYSFRKSNNGGSDDTNASITGTLYATHNGSVDHYAEFYVVNVSNKEKLIIGTCTDANSNNQEPRRKEFASKWVNTSSQITSVQTVNTGSGSNPIGVGSRITVWGAN